MQTHAAEFGRQHKGNVRQVWTTYQGRASQTARLHLPALELSETSLRYDERLDDEMMRCRVSENPRAGTWRDVFPEINESALLVTHQPQITSMIQAYRAQGIEIPGITWKPDWKKIDRPQVEKMQLIALPDFENFRTRL